MEPTDSIHTVDTAPRDRGSTIAVNLLRAAWWSILLGCAIEIVVLTITATWGKDRAPLIAGFVQKISWATFVCVGLAIGAAAARASRHLMMGVLGLLCAPMAFAAARALHKSVLHALGAAGAGAAGGEVWLPAILKAIEYGVFGLVIGRLSGRDNSTLRSYALSGLMIGLAFAIITVFLSMGKPGVGGVDLAARCANELLFPIGCALILYSVQAVARAASPRAD